MHQPIHSSLVPGVHARSGVRAVRGAVCPDLTSSLITAPAGSDRHENLRDHAMAGIGGIAVRGHRGTHDEGHRWSATSKPSLEKRPPNSMSPPPTRQSTESADTLKSRTPITPKSEASFLSKITRTPSVRYARSESAYWTPAATDPVTFSYDAEKEKFERESARYTHMVTPWLNEDGSLKEDWRGSRVLAAKIVLSQHFEWLMGAVIVFNLIWIVIETDKEARCYPDFANELSDCESSSSNLPYIKIVNLVLLVVYTLEAIARMYVERMEFFWKAWNQLDFTIVFLGWLTEFLGIFIEINSIGWLRIVRIARLFRAMRIFVANKELHMLLTGLIGSMKAIFFGSLMLLAMLILFSILMVQYVHPISSRLECGRCSEGFSSVMDSTLTLFQQIVAGDSWGTISIPVIMEEPWAAVPLCMTLMTIGLGAMNLILAVIVDRAAEARESKGDILIAQKQQMQRIRRMELLEMFQEMDKDSSGTLTLEELTDAWLDSGSRFREMMSLMDLHQGDLEEIFETIDGTHRGEINYLQFCNSIDQMQSRDTRFLATLTKLRVSHLHRVVEKDIVRNCKILSRHDRLLEYLADLIHGVDEKICRLTGDACQPFGLDRYESRSKSSLYAKAKTFTRHNTKFGTLGSKTSAFSSMKEARTERFSDDIDLLQEQIEDLDNINRGVLRRCQEQAATVLHHREFMESLSDAFIMASREEQRTLAESMHSQISDLLEATKCNLVKSVEDINVKMQAQADLLASNAKVFEGLNALLPGPYQLKQRLTDDKMFEAALTSKADAARSRLTPHFGPAISRGSRGKGTHVTFASLHEHLAVEGDLDDTPTKEDSMLQAACDIKLPDNSENGIADQPVEYSS